jgi:uncharacterized protein (DUF1330 family)
MLTPLSLVLTSTFRLGITLIDVDVNGVIIKTHYAAWRSEMAKGYWVAAYRTVHDANKLAAYGVLATQVVKAAGGRFLVRGGEVVAFQAGLKERTVVVEFPSFELALATFRSADYQTALDILGDGAERDARVVAGVDD